MTNDKVSIVATNTDVWRADHLQSSTIFRYHIHMRTHWNHESTLARHVFNKAIRTNHQPH